MKRYITFIGVALITLVIASLLYLKFRKLDDFEPQIKGKLQKLVHDASKGLYRLDIEKINADIVGSKVIFSNVNIRYDSLVYVKLRAAKQAPADVFNIHLNSLALDGITPEDLIRKKDIHLNILLIEKPVVHVYHHQLDYERPKKETSVYDVVHKEIGSFALNSLDLKHVEFIYHHVASKVQTSFKDLNVSLKDILIDSKTQSDTTRFLYAKDATLSLKDFKHKTADSLYNFKLDSITILAAKNEVQIQSLRMEPRISKADYPKVLKSRKDRFDILIQHVVLENINWWALLADEGIYVDHAFLSKGKIEVYTDRTLPSNETKLGNYPHQQLFKTDLPIGIKKIDAADFDISYIERNPKTLKTGGLDFISTQATLTNITNIPSWIKKDEQFKIDATTRFMDEGKLKVGFRFNLRRQKEGIFSVSAEMGPMSGLKLNKATIGLAAVEIKQANFTHLKVDINGNNVEGKGKILVTYSDLKVDVLKKDDKGKFKKRGLITFIANNFKIKQQNPKKGEKAKAVNAYYKKPPEKSFFALIWKTIFAGVKESAGL
ncbi:hypothetical protein ADIARSV_1382 [Arcticibacter svalbardensis MN12-7]|uniref:DUF748 domain-containing protein n=1 Tax=Arcticibacter svalbardensis MN12-7 TaxID=1150600 RepID=R9GUH3_9SPHI|nr:hypothetical protein [Arcticibacter svalbardensis]EOR95381.1 hypothetical protein ADIARSV_1382 [Arcticibacter svalbardensis MN12-7]